MIESGARCGLHPQVAAVDVCKRCGKFLCGECVELVGEDAYCAACSQRVDAPASRLAKSALGVAGFAWLSVGATYFTVKALMLVVPAPLALAAMVMGVLERRRIRRGEAPARGRRWTLSALAVATPLFFLMAALIAYVVIIVRQG